MLSGGAFICKFLKKGVLGVNKDNSILLGLQFNRFLLQYKATL